MIDKFANMQNSWFTKIVLSVTALSFMSLFGVSGYYGMAGRNKAVIKVDNIEMTQSEFSYLLQKELLKYKNFSDEEFDENSAQKAQIINMLAKNKLDEALIDNTMRKYNIDFTEDLVQQIILTLPQFNYNGQFNPEVYKMFLSRESMSERDLIAEIKRDLGRKVLLDSQVAYINVPKVLLTQIVKIAGQRRTFKYVSIVNDKAQITRQPSEDELDQFYEDFSEDFMLPETRDVTVMFLSDEDLQKNIEVSKDEIKTYYKEHIEEFEKPQQRHVMQMVFATEKAAKSAAAELNSGADFLAVAEKNGQSLEETDWGYVDYNSMGEEVADVVFELKKGQVSEPVNLAGSWQILTVIDVTEAEKMPQKDAEEKILAEIRDDKSYDYNYEVISKIEDGIGAGKTIGEIADIYGTKLFSVMALDEQGNTAESNGLPESLLSNRDFLDAVFSYNEGETSQTVETDEGLAVVFVNKITEAHMQPREEAEAKLRVLWQENERASITQELVDNIEHDIDAGDNLTDIAKRYNLPLKSTMPVTRNENFADLSFVEMTNLFSMPQNVPLGQKLGDDYIIAETTSIYDDSASISDNDKIMLEQVLYEQMTRDMADALLKDYAKNYKIEVNYQRMGLGDE